MAIITQYHRDTNTTYVYESTSYWDPEKGQSRSKRKCIGKIDPETGQMVPTGKRGRQKKADQDKTDNGLALLYEQSQKEVCDLKAKVAMLEEQAATLAGENRKLRAALDKISALCSGILV